MTCANRFCPHCNLTAEEQWGKECPDCDSHLPPCGDEGQLCPECFAKEDARMRRYFGLRPDMTPAQRREQLERMRPLGAEGKTGAEVE